MRNTDPKNEMERARDFRTLWKLLKEISDNHLRLATTICRTSDEVYNER